MELDYVEWLKVIKSRKELINDIALEEDKYNAEFINLSKIEELIRKILKEKL